jgi:MFS family permease
MSAETVAAPGFLQSRIGGLPRAFWVLWTGTVINRLGTMVTPFMTLYLVGQRGLSVVAAGGIMTAFGAGSLISQLLGGALADRIGRRGTMLGGTLATAVLMTALAYARPIPLIIALVLPLGVTLDIYRPAAQALIADLIPEPDRARAYGLQFWGVNLGFAVAMTAAGFLATVGFTWLFLVDAATGAVFGLLVFLMVREAPRPHVSEQGEPGGFRDVLRDRPMVIFTFCTLLYILVYLQVETTLPLSMREDGVGTSTYGLAMAVNGLLICIVQPLIGPWLNRLDPVRIWAAGVLAVGVGFGLTAFASSALGYLGTVVIWTLAEIPPAAASGAIVARLAPPHLRGRYAGVYGLSWSVAGFLAALGGSSLLAAGSTLLWTSCFVICAVAALGMLRLARRSGADSTRSWNGLDVAIIDRGGGDR